MNKFRKKKERKFNEDPHCRRCGVLTWLPSRNYGRATKRLTKEQHDTMATIAHKFSRLDDRRITESADNKKYELICQKCNQEEARAEVSKLTTEEQWERSQAYPKGHIMDIANRQNIHNLNIKNRISNVLNHEVSDTRGDAQRFEDGNQNSTNNSEVHKEEQK